MQVLHHQEQGLDLARPQQQARACLQRVLAALRRIEGLPGWIVHGDVQERQHGRQDRLKARLQCAELAYDFGAGSSAARRARPNGSRL